MGMLPSTCNLQGLELHQCRYHPDQPVSGLLLGFAGCSWYIFLYSIDLGALWTLIQEIFTLTISGYWRILMILEFHLIWRFEWDEMMKKWKLGWSALDERFLLWQRVEETSACGRSNDAKQVGAEGTTGEVESAVEPGLCRPHVEGVG